MNDINVLEARAQAVLAVVPHKLWMEDEPHFHLSVTELDLCQADQDHEDEEQSKAEYAAELAVERYFEDRGYWDAREQEDWEAARGIMQPAYWDND